MNTIIDTNTEEQDNNRNSEEQESNDDIIVKQENSTKKRRATRNSTGHKITLLLSLLPYTFIFLSCKIQSMIKNLSQQTCPTKPGRHKLNF